MAALAITDFDGGIDYLRRHRRLKARQNVQSQELRSDLANSLNQVQSIKTKRQKRRNRKK